MDSYCSGVSNTMKFYRKKKAIILMLSIILVLVVLNSKMVKRQFLSSRQEVFTSPLSGHYLTLYRYNTILPLSPGNSGDTPGFIRLYNENGIMLNQTDVAMVQLVNDVRWSKDRITIKFVADWPIKE